MNQLPTIVLKPGEADRIVAGHPWVYGNSILRLTSPASDGDVVQPRDLEGRRDARLLVLATDEGERAERGEGGAPGELRREGRVAMRAWLTHRAWRLL